MSTITAARGLRTTASTRARSELIGAAWLGGRLAARRLLTAGTCHDEIRREVAARVVERLEDDRLDGPGRAEVAAAASRGADEVLAGR